MPRLATRSAIWILTLLFRLAVTENKTYPDPREDRFWKQRPFRGNKSLETVGSESLNEILRFRTIGDINFKGYKNASVKKRTLMDYNGPAVITEDLDDTSDQNLASHIRVKRNEPVIYRRSSSVNLLPRNSRRRFDDSTLKGSRSDDGTRFGITMDTLHSRGKRGVLSKNGYRKKRVKGNTGHSKHNVETGKHGVLKAPRRLGTKKTNNPNSKKRSKNTQKIGMPDKTIDELRTDSRIEKREFRNSDFNINSGTPEDAEVLIGPKEDALINNRSRFEQKKENAIMLPFVHTGRAELRVRIEKIPMNESSSFISSNHWTNRPVETSPCSITLPKYNISAEILVVNVTNPKLAPNFDSAGGKKATNITNITPKTLDFGSNVSGQETSESENTSFYNVESYPIRSNVPGIEDNRNTENEKYDRTKMSVEFSNEDAKSRAKRNQQVASQRYLQNDKSAKGSRRFRGTKHGVEDTKSEKTRIRGNRAVRSIEEIKDLAEKLIAKINELQVYVSNPNETLRERNSCLGKHADRAAVERKRKISLEKKDVSSSTSKIENADHCLAKEATLVDKTASSLRSSGSRFARGEYRTRNISRRKWGRWMNWSSCSVTCGKGRQIRWRHCLHDCNDAETEMEEKACQLPACPPSKFLGIF